MSELSAEASKLLESVKRNPIDLYFGRGMWKPDRLPKGVRMKHFNELMNSGLVRIHQARLKPAENDNADED